MPVDTLIAGALVRGGFGFKAQTTDYEEIQELVKTYSLRYADFWFSDLAGRPWRISMPTRDLSPEVFECGLSLDAQAVGGSWNGLVIFRPRRDSVYRDPAALAPTLAMICDIIDPITGEAMQLEPRHVLRKAEELVKTTHGASLTMGAEPEFMLFDENGKVASEDMVWDFLRAFATAMDDSGIQIDWFRTGPAVGQGRIQVNARAALNLADCMMLYRNTAKNLARRSGLTISFLPRPSLGEGAPGMPMHLALWKGGINLFHSDEGWALTSDLCRWYAGGILAHLPALLAFCAPTTNSYRRLIPGHSGPTVQILSTTLKSAACRVPARSKSPGARRIKFCCPDSMANPYLAFAAVIMAGLDGITRRLEPPKDGSPPLMERFPQSLEASLEALDADRAFLTENRVFTDYLIDAWIKDRWESHILPGRSQPHPWEMAHSDPFGSTRE